MRSSLPPAFGLIASLVFAGLAEAGAPPALAVERHAPEQVLGRFSLAALPTGTRTLPPGTQAYTWCHYGLRSWFTHDTRSRPGRNGGVHVEITVRTVKLDLTLTTTLLLPEQPAPWLTAHEHGHRKLGEHFYRDAVLATAVRRERRRRRRRRRSCVWGPRRERLPPNRSGPAWFPALPGSKRLVGRAMVEGSNDSSRSPARSDGSASPRGRMQRAAVPPRARTGSVFGLEARLPTEEVRGCARDVGPRRCDGPSARRGDDRTPRHLRRRTCGRCDEVNANAEPAVPRLRGEAREDPTSVDAFRAVAAVHKGRATVQARSPPSAGRAEPPR